MKAIPLVDWRLKKFEIDICSKQIVFCLNFLNHSACILTCMSHHVGLRKTRFRDNSRYSTYFQRWIVPVSQNLSQRQCRIGLDVPLLVVDLFRWRAIVKSAAHFKVLGLVVDRSSYCWGNEQTTFLLDIIWNHIFVEATIIFSIGLVKNWILEAQRMHFK